MHLKRLDALRGLLALYVLAGHARWLLWEGASAFASHARSWWALATAYGTAGLRFGHEAVMVFFVLSGFFIHLKAAESLAEGRVPGLSAGAFCARRAQRLLPPYFLDRKSTRLNSSHVSESRMPSSA